MSNYKVVTTDRYRRGNQYGQVRKGSKVFTEYGIETPNGKIIAIAWYQKKRAYNFAIELLNNGLTVKQLNSVDCDMLADHAVIGIGSKHSLEAPALEIAALQYIAKKG